MLCLHGDAYLINDMGSGERTLRCYIVTFVNFSKCDALMVRTLASGASMFRSGPLPAGFSSGMRFQFDHDAGKNAGDQFSGTTIPTSTHAGVNI